MRKDYPQTSMKSDVAKASRERGGSISKKEQVEAHEASFGTLLSDVNKNVGLPGDEVLYHDPMGFTTGGDPVDLRTKMYEKMWSGAFDRFNAEVRKGAGVYEAAKTVSKALDRSVFSLPIFVSPDVTITDTRQTPVADMVPRVAIEEDTYKVDEQIDHGDAERFYEPGTNSGTDETWVENDDTYLTHTYNVLPYGRQTAVTDFLQLAANSLRSTRSITEEALMRSQRFYEENQVIRGNGTAASGDVAGGGNDANGWAGLPELVASESEQLTDEGGTGKMSVAKAAEHIEELRRDGAAYDDIVHVTDHKTFNDLKREVDDFTRYQSPGDSINFGFRALNVDGTPVMESHGAPNTDGERVFASFDASEHLMAMLQDATMHPLARTTPEEDVAVDSYGVFASSSTRRIRYRYDLA
jgi:hypothetical protein